MTRIGQTLQGDKELHKGLEQEIERQWEGIMEGYRNDLVDRNDLGKVVSVLCHWSGQNILTGCQAALTDANFHDEAEIVAQLIADIAAGRPRKMKK